MAVPVMALLATAQATPVVHVAIEWLAYFVGARVYFRHRRASPIAVPRGDQLLLLACVVIIYVRAILLGPGGAQQLMWVLGALLLRTPASEDGGRK